MYHGIIIDQEFINPSFPKNFKIFAKKQDKDWRIYGIEVGDSQLKQTIESIQTNMKNDQPWYTHFYNDNKLIVIFKNKTIEVTPLKSSWQSIIDYGKELNIPEEQLDFWPNRFQDEIHYFSKDDFLKIPSTQSRSKIMKDFKNVGLYSPKFLKDLENGLKDSQYFNKK